MKLRRYLRGLACLWISLHAAGAVADPMERFEQAAAMSVRGDHETALVEISRLRAEFPENVDYALLRAQVLARLDRDREALQELRTASRLAPGYEAVWELRFAVLARTPGDEFAAETETVLQEAARRFPASDWWATSRRAAPTRNWEVLLGAGHDDLSGGRTGWNSQFAEARFAASEATTYFAGLSRDDRFAGADTSVRLGADWMLGQNWVAGIDLSAANSPGFLAERALAAYAGRGLGDGWVATLRVRQREYPATHSTTLGATVEKYIADYRLAYGLNLSRLPGSAAFAGHTVSADWYFSGQASAGVVINAGNEAEAVAAGEVLESSVRGVAVRGHRDISRRLTLRWWLGWQDQGDFYERRFLGLAVSIRI